MSDSYARWRASRLGRITDALEQRLLFDLLGPIAGKSLLDVGCSDGAIASELARRDAVVTGLDSDPVAIAAAWRRAGVEGVQLWLVEGKAESLPFSDATFDAVLAVATLCFVPDAERALSEMARVLKPGGRLVIGELGRWSLWAVYRRFRGWFGHPTWRAARFRSETELRRLLEVGGFDVVETRGAIFYPPCGVAARLLAAEQLALLGGEARFDVLRERHLASAGLADAAAETLGEEPLKHAGDEEGFGAHVDQTADRARGVVRVQGREHEVAREGGLRAARWCPLR